MSDIAKRLLEERANTWEQAKALLDHAAEEKRDLTSEEEVSYQKMTGDLETLRAKADKYVEDERNAKAAEESLRSLISQRPERSNKPEGDDELRKFFAGEAKTYDARPLDSEVRDLSKGTATAGGNTVPTSMYSQIWEHLRENATLLAGGATVINTSSGENIDVPITTSFGAAAAVAEAGALAESDPAFGKRTLGAYKFGQLVQISSELTQDSAFNLEGFLARVVGQNVGNAFGAKLITGAGSTEPTGITTSSTLGVTGATSVAGVPTLDNLIDLYYSVIAPYRNKSAAQWLMKDSTAAVIRKFREGAGTGQYLWQPSIVAGQPDLLLSKPVLTDPNVAATAIGAKSVLFGDLSSYAVRIVAGIRFERSDDYSFNTDQTTFRAIIRGDGLLIDQTGAVKHFIGGAS